MEERVVLAAELLLNLEQLGEELLVSREVAPTSASRSAIRLASSTIKALRCWQAVKQMADSSKAGTLGPGGAADFGYGITATSTLNDAGPGRTTVTLPAPRLSRSSAASNALASLPGLVMVTIR